MRRLNGPELGILAIAAVFVIVGVVMLVHPTESVVFHEAYRWVHSSPIEHVSKTESRIYGILAIIFGGGFVWLVFYKRGEK